MSPIVSILAGVIPDLLKRFFPGETAEESLKRLELQTELTKAIMESEQGQLRVNEVEAASTNLFVSGWRPFVGWTCAIALVYSTIGVHLINYALALKGLPALPLLNTDELNTILYGMLGIGSMRSVEKISAVKDSAVSLFRNRK
mgnify:CR=1 FL=1